jgi:hypothetical protein
MASSVMGAEKEVILTVKQPISSWRNTPASQGIPLGTGA